jgi:hypothetical protein
MPTTLTERGSTPYVTDDELVERTLRGDSTAFGELVFRRGPAVYRAALAALGSAADAEDVMQEAFVLAFRKLPHFRDDASFKTLDRYAARCGNSVLALTRIAVLAARSAARDTGNQARGSAGISRGGAPWLVLTIVFERSGRVSSDA